MCLIHHTAKPTAGQEIPKRASYSFFLAVFICLSHRNLSRAYISGGQCQTEWDLGMRQRRNQSALCNFFIQVWGSHAQFVIGRQPWHLSRKQSRDISFQQAWLLSSRQQRSSVISGIVVCAAFATDFFRRVFLLLFWIQLTMTRKYVVQLRKMFVRLERKSLLQT